MVELPKIHDVELTGHKTRLAIVVVGMILTIILAGVIALSDFQIPLYALVLVVGCPLVVVALLGVVVFGEREELRALPGGVLEYLSRRAIMVASVTGGLLAVLHLLNPALYTSTPSVVLWLLVGIVISSLSAIAVAICSEEARY
ncbi:MAG: hypothetical protein ACWGQW_15575 [bacterium]